MRDKTCPTWSNRSYSREKPKAEMEYMSTLNCSLHKNDLISLTLTTFSLLFVALKSWPLWMMAVGNLLMQWTIWSGIYSISGHFWLWFLTIVLDSREARIWFWSSAAWPLTFLFLSFSIFLLLGNHCPWSLLSPPPSNGLEINKPPPLGGLNKKTSLAPVVRSWNTQNWF